MTMLKPMAVSNAQVATNDDGVNSQSIVQSTFSRVALVLNLACEQREDPAK